VWQKFFKVPYLESLLKDWMKRYLLAKSLLEKKYPYLTPDALYEKVRTYHRVVSKGILIIIRIGEDGYREVLSVDIANTETKKF